MRKILTVMLSAALVLSLAACGGKTTTNMKEETTDIAEEMVDGEEIRFEEKLSFELVAGEAGEYGTPVIFNKGTDLEETIIAYHVPAGTYTVTNNGEYMNQISIYSDETHITEEGWEEPAEAFGAKLIDAGKTDTISIEEGQYIELSEPAFFSFEMQ